MFQQNHSDQRGAFNDTMAQNGINDWLCDDPGCINAKPPGNWVRLLEHTLRKPTAPRLCFAPDGVASRSVRCTNPQGHTDTRPHTPQTGMGAPTRSPQL